MNLKLTLNPDILDYFGKLKRQGNLINNAKKKLKEKNLDIVVANPLDIFGSQATELVIIDNQGTVMKLPLMSKKHLAIRLLKLIEKTSA